jgi:GntR family transcriptional regulator / MocR family aminotransferase
VLPDGLPLAVNRQDPRPLAIQLADGLRAAAASGALRKGDRLPSTRALATTLAVSRTVTAAAYEVLQAEGWIGGRRGAGTYVIAAPGLSARKHAEVPRVQSQEPARGIDLRPGTPWAAGMCSAAWRRAWRAAADPPMLTRPVLAGLPEFRAAVVEHLVRHRGLAVQPDAVLATGGSTAAVAELAAVLLRPGDVVAVEEPGYPRAVATLRAAGLHVLPAPVDSEGLVVAALPDRARAVYCTPAHQFPLGATLSARRRLALVAWARERAAWVLEDDYDGELRHHGAPLPLLASVGPDVVVHLGTASKILTPTLGVGGWRHLTRWWPGSVHTDRRPGFGRHRPVNGCSPRLRCPETSPGTCAGYGGNCSPAAICWLARCARRRCRFGVIKPARTWW